MRTRSDRQGTVAKAPGDVPAAHPVPETIDLPRTGRLWEWGNRGPCTPNRDGEGACGGRERGERPDMVRVCIAACVLITLAGGAAADASANTILPSESSSVPYAPPARFCYSCGSLLSAGYYHTVNK